MASSLESQLIRDGYVVIRLYADDELRRMQDLYVRTLRSLPEYKASAPGMQYSKTGFGALGTASSFHNAFVRAVRLRAYAEAEGLLRAYDKLDPTGLECAPNRDGTRRWTGFQTARVDEAGRRLIPRNLHEVVCRMIVRAPDQAPSKESMHQDVSPCNDGDTIFGGWVAFSDQTARLAPGTQNEVSADPKGFSKIDVATAPYRTQEIPVPAGCMLIMRQTIVHEIAPNPVKGAPMLRVSTGWRLTYDESDTLLEKAGRLGNPRQDGRGAPQSHAAMIQSMAVPKIASNQMPSMYNVRNVDDARQREGLRDWFDSYITEELLTEREYYSRDYAKGKRDAQGNDVPERALAGTLKMDRMMPLFAPSIEQMLAMPNPPERLAMWYANLPAYMPVELQIIKPHRMGTVEMGALFDEVRTLIDSIQ